MYCIVGRTSSFVQSSLLLTRLDFFIYNPSIYRRMALQPLWTLAAYSVS
jgi:hypothetical protein